MAGNVGVSSLPQKIMEEDSLKIKEFVASSVKGKNKKDREEIYATSLHEILRQNCGYDRVKNFIDAIKDIEKTFAGVEDSRIEEKLKRRIKQVIDYRLDGRTSLDILLKKSNPSKKIIGLLLDNNTDVNDRDSNDDNAISLIVKNCKLWKKLSKDQELMEKFFKNADLGYRNNGNNYLHIAAKRANTEAFLFICKKNYALVNRYNTKGENPFLIAGLEGILPDILKRLIEDFKIEDATIETENDPILKERLKENLKENKKYVKAAYVKVVSIKKYRPLHNLDNEIQKECKEYFNIKSRPFYKKPMVLSATGIAITLPIISVTFMLLYQNTQHLALSLALGACLIPVCSICVKTLTKECSDIIRPEPQLDDLEVESSLQHEELKPNL